MKKTIILLFVFVSIQIMAYSQESRTFLTLYGGFGDAQAKDAKLSSGLGLDFDLALSEKVHFNLKPTLNIRGYTGLITTKPTFFDIPVTFEFSLDENSKHMFLGLGGYYGMALTGKFKNTLSVTGNTDWQKMSFGETELDMQSKSDYGAVINIGGYFPGYNGAIKAGIQWMKGFKNVAPEEKQDDEIYNHLKLSNITVYMAFSLFNM